MKIHTDILQGSPEWLELRKGKITGTDVGPWTLEPKSICLTIDQIKAILDSFGIGYKASGKKDDFLKLLPDLDSYRKLSSAALRMIFTKIKDAQPLDPWQKLQEEKLRRQFDYLIQIQRGNALEPFARQFYGRLTGNTVTEVAFVENDFGDYGMSPDGLVFELDSENVLKGLEIKCPFPETHLMWLWAWLNDREFPAVHYWQCHMGMAVTGANQWDFLSFCPGETPLLITLDRSEDTEKLADGLEALAEAKIEVEDRLAQIWTAQFEGKQHLMTHKNGRAMFAEDGGMLDENGERMAFEADAEILNLVES